MKVMKPPQPGSAEHWALWLKEYGDDHATDNERRGAYQDFLTNLTTIQHVFSQPDRMHTAGYLAAHERVADGDAESPDDAELWVPADLGGPARAEWLEGFRSHFEPSAMAEHWQRREREVDAHVANGEVVVHGDGDALLEHLDQLDTSSCDEQP